MCRRAVSLRQLSLCLQIAKYSLYVYFDILYHSWSSCFCHFYRAMHYTAKRGIAIACRPSVRLSVCNVGGSGPHRLEILKTNCTEWQFALRSPKAIHLPQGKHGGNLGRIEIGWEKVACWSTKAEISLKRLKIEKKLLWRAYRNSPTLFRTAPSETPCGLLFPKIDVRNPHPKLQSLLSQTQERVKLRTSPNLWRTLIGSIGTKAH